jgi:hypothetical protein
MTSNVDPTVPVQGSPTTLSVRTNFATIKSEISALQSGGSQGPAGPPANMAVGSTTTGSPGTSANVSMTGTAPNYTMFFTIPQGANGTIGPAPNLSIGSTTTGGAGTNAAVSITGNSPTYSLNFTIPQGIPGSSGATGPAPNLIVGSTTTGAPTDPASVTISGTSPNYTLNFTIPQGAPGSASPPGAITMGGDVGGTAAASVVQALRGVNLSGVAPVNGQVLTYNGTNWAGASPASVSSVTMGGDVTGASGSSKVVALQNFPVASTTPLNTQVLTFNGTNWAAAAVPTTPPTTSVTMGGDVTGNSATAKVTAIQNIPVSSSAPTLNQIFAYNGTVWAPAAPVTQVTMAGDVSGASNAAKVTALQNIPISSVVPTNTQILTYNGTNWAAANPPAAVTSVTMAGEVTGPSSASVVSLLQGQPIGTTTPQRPSGASPWGFLAWNNSVQQWEYEPGVAQVNTCSAAGTTQSSATAIPVSTTGTGGFIEVTGGTGGVRWDTPGLQTGAHVYVRNSTTNIVNLYPPTGGTINGLAANTPISVMPDTTASLLGFSSSRIITVP